MNKTYFLLSFLAAFTLVSCEKNSTLSPTIGRFVASEHLIKIDGKETLPSGVKEYLFEEQNLQIFNFSHDDTPTSVYAPKNNPKFLLPYYLIPEEDAHFFFSNSLDSEVSDQLTMKISGKKHYKLFIHPLDEVHYDLLRSSYRYISPDQTEFFASPTSSNRTLVVWNRNNSERKPFITKLHLENGKIDLQTNENVVKRSIANQRFFNRIGDKKLNSMNLKFFPQSAGLTVEKMLTGTSQKLGAQLIYEIPDELIQGNKRWLSFSTMMSLNRKPVPLIMDIIKRSGLSSYDFFKTYMIDSYLAMFEEISLKNGINFEPDSQNLMFETTNDLKPTGVWVFKDLGRLWPDIFSVAKNKGPVDVYMENASATKFKFKSARSSSIRNYVFFYKSQIFDRILVEVAKNDPALTDIQIQALKDSLDLKYTKLINAYLGLNLKAAPNLTDYTRIEELVVTQTELDSKIEKKEIKETENLKTFIENKKDRNEWVELSSAKGKSAFYLTDHGLYEISNKKIVGFALFNHDELEEYNANNKMLTIFSMPYVEIPDPTSCFGMTLEYLEKMRK